MYVVCVTIWVKPEHIESFMEASLDNATNTRQESGNLRFDVLRCADPDNQFFLYEVYNAEEDFKSHHQTEHYARWRGSVEPWMEKPRVAVKHASLFPDDDPARWKA